ncbi:DUF2975 domain-containing protein [uncultured Litoreibacter sp.]|uniref:DUF2975 domain-containing protein n=1 Tax=uncultured Litoreibacter sp. TaxID=1392394 RepID=UPI00261A1BAA|nr:DUF2975 domain-containing protein [uncultured Litoreibacter sp.]
MMELSNRFRALAQGLFWISTVAMAGMVLLVVGVAVMPDLAKTAFVDNAPAGLNVQTVPSTGTVYALLAAGSIALGLQLFVLWNMRALFRMYARGYALSAKCGTHIARIGAGVIAMPFAWMFYDVVSSYLLTRNNPAGEGQVTLGISGSSVGLIVGGGMLLLVGAAMLEASRQAEENRSFV